MEYTTIQKTADRWGISKARVHQFCQEGRIPGALYEKKHWRVPVDAEKPTKYAVIPGFLSAAEIARRWDLEASKVIGMCQAGAIPGVENVGHKYIIPQDAVNPLEGYLLVSEMAEKWGMNRALVSRFCKDGRISGVKQVGRNWYIPADAKKPVDGKVVRMSGYISASKMAEKWGITRQHVCRACVRGEIPGAERIGRYWHIPEDAEKPVDGRGKRK